MNAKKKSIHPKIIQNIPATINPGIEFGNTTFKKAFLKVVLPNSIPGLIVAGMFCIIFGWIDFFFAFILTFTEVQLLPVKIVALNSSVTPWWSLSASALVSVAPLIIVAFIVERYLSKGNLSGAIK